VHRRAVGTLNKITSLATPTNLTDALCKSYVAGLVNLSFNYATTTVSKSLSYWLGKIKAFGYNVKFNPGNYITFDQCDLLNLTTRENSLLLANTNVICIFRNFRGIPTFSALVNRIKLEGFIMINQVIPEFTH